MEKWKKVDITPTSMINGRGKKYTYKDFIKISKEIHKNKYDYSNVIFETQLEKVKIICPIHGCFEQTPRQHCPTCGAYQSGMNRAK